MTINGTSVGSGTVPTTGAAIGTTNVSNTIAGLTGTVTVVISLSGASGTGTFRIDDFTLNGTVTSTGTAPTVTTTNSATSITTATATVGGGTITANGTPATITGGGIVYGTSAAPTGNATSTWTTGTAIPAASISSLTSNTLYYYRAYASNGLTGYGADQTFTTLAAVTNGTAGSITSNSASINTSSIAAGGAATVTGRGVVWSTSDATPTIAEGATQVTNGTGTGSFSTSLTSLPAGTLIYFNSYAINGGGTSYGTAGSFTTNSAASPSLAISGTASHGTLCVGTAGTPITYTITNSGGGDATGISVASDNAEFAITTALSSTTVTQSGGTVTFGVTFTPSAGGSRTATLTVTGGGGATYAISGTGTALTAPPAPTANTATAGGTSTATLGGTTTAASCPSTLTEQGIVLSSSVTTPTTADTKFTFANNTPGVKTVGVTGLTPGTRYYYRTYATNSQGTTYNGTVSSFNTRKLEPTNHATSFTNSAQTSTTLTFTWSDNSGVALADSFLVRLSTGTPADPTDGVLVTATSTDVYVARGVQTVTFSGLTSSTTYNAKIYPLVNTGVGGVDYKTSATVPSASGTTSTVPITLMSWEMTGLAGTENNVAYTTVDANISTSTTPPLGVIRRGSSLSGASLTNGMNSTGFGASQGTNAYYEFAIQPVTNANMTITSIRAYIGSGSSGSNNWALRSSVDGFTSNIGSGTFTANTDGNLAVTTLPATGFTNVTGQITFRLYEWGGNTGRIRNNTAGDGGNEITILGYSVAAPPAPVLAITSQTSGSTYAYGNVETGTFVDKVFTLTNNGTATLNISSMSTSGTGYSIQAGGSTTTIAASASANVTVRYTPSSFSLQSGTFDVQSDDATNPTYTVNLTGTGTPSAQSDITNLTTPNATVDYTLYQSSTITNVTTGANGSYGLMRFDIRDGGGIADNDALPTILQDITFTVNNGYAIRQAALFSTSNGKLSTNGDPVINAAAGTIAFTSLPAANFTVSDGGTLSIWLRVSFTATVTDNQAITVTVSNTNTVAASGNTSSSFKTFSLTSSGTANKTIVTGTGIAFVTQPPTSVGVNSNFGLTIQVQDANGNRDLDVSTGTITLTKLTGGGSLSGGTSGSFTSGLFTTSTLQIDQLTTGVTLQASLSPTLTPGPNVIVSNSFDVNGVGYVVGCYRTKSSGTTAWGTASNWEILQSDGVTWTTATSAPTGPQDNTNTFVVHVERSMTMGCNGSSKWALNKLYIKNSSTTLTTNDGSCTVPGVDIWGTDGELRVLGGTFQTDGGVSLQNTTATITVDSLAKLIINYNASNQSLIWKGVENFKPGSILEIQKWNTGASGDADKLIDVSGTNTVSDNSAGYKFGNVIINASGLTASLKLVANSPTVNFCKNDLTITNSGSFNVIGSAGAATITYGGNIIVNSNQFSFYAQTATTTNTSTVNGNLQIANNATVDLNQNNAAGGTSTVILKGNYISTGTADLICTDATGTCLIQFDGAKSHTVTQSTTSTDPCVNIAWQITAADSITASSNWGLSNNSSVTVQTGGLLQFGNNGSAPYRVTEVASAAATTAFTLQTGATLVINDQNGITSSGATGNVQTDTRSFSNGSNYYYKTYAGFTQATGSGFDALVGSPFTGVITWEGFSNAQSLTFPSSFTINTPGKLVVKRGFISESATAGQPTIDGSGDLDMSGGQLVFNRVGSSLTFPRLTGTYTITGGIISLNGTANSASNIQRLRGGRTYYDVSLGGSSSLGGYKTITSAVVINGTLTIPTGEIFDPASNGVTGPGNLTMTGGVYRTSKLTNNQPELGGTYTLSAGTVELYGTSASQQQNLRSKDDANNTITYATVLVNAAAANTAGNVDLTGFTGVSTEFRVNSPAYLNMDAAEGLTGTGNFVLTNGTGLRFANAYGIRTSGTGTTDGNIRVSGTRTLPTQATYIAAGSATSASLGNAIPDGADSVIIARTSGDISTAGALKVGQKLRFASASKILTGTDTVTIGATGSVVGEAEDRYVYGLLKVYRASIAQNVLTDIGGMGLTVEALGGAPGYFTATRRTGPGSAQTGYQNNQSTARYYSLHAANNTGLNAKLTFTYFDSELNGVPETLLTAYRSQDNGVTWSQYPAIARNSVQNFVRVQNVPGFSEWVLGSYDAPLPVELSSFTGHLQGRVAVLDWTTASERNNAGFELLRSADGRNFVKIGWVAAKPEARGGNYSFTDAGFTGKAYYRLRQVDRDGAAKESQTVFLSRDNAELATAQLFPMPAEGKLTLTWPGQEEQIVTARLLSVDGKLIQTGTGSLAEISALLSAQVSALPSGVYQLHLVGAEQAQTILRVVK